MSGSMAHHKGAVGTDQIQLGCSRMTLFVQKVLIVTETDDPVLRTECGVPTEGRDPLSNIPQAFSAVELHQAHRLRQGSDVTVPVNESGHQGGAVQVHEVCTVCQRRYFRAAPTGCDSAVLHQQCLCRTLLIHG